MCEEERRVGGGMIRGQERGAFCKGEEKEKTGAYDVCAGEDPHLHGAQLVDVVQHGAAVLGRGFASDVGVQGILAGEQDATFQVGHVTVLDHIVSPAHTHKSGAQSGFSCIMGLS